MLTGFDLHGNTYWEFRVSTRGVTSDESTERWRRIVNYPRSTHLSSVKVSPQWHQWLRHTRHNPPTLEEQHGDVARQIRMKKLAAEADARWEAKPRLTAAPRDPAPALASSAAETSAQEAARSVPKREAPAAVNGDAAGQGDADPWARARSHGPGEKWQPEAWTPAPGKKRS
jgi:NADH dehydrogenase [ubiquinone] 1 alpha subcomplex assembly factor 2